MGPRPRGRGNAEPPRSTSASSRPAFNGASSTWTRKRLQVGRGRHRVGRLPSMGPRPRGRGNQGGARGARGIALPFNGASSTWTRKPRPRARSYWASPPFNGASSTWTRKPATSSTTTTRSTPFNGASSTWTRKHSASGFLRSKMLGPSMGPRPRGRGNVDVAVHGVDEALPSMGPRPRGRGNGPHRPAAAPRGQPSMGPRPRGRGNTGTGTTRTSMSKNLQWGLVHVDEETARAVRPRITVRWARRIERLAATGLEGAGKDADERPKLHPDNTCTRSSVSRVSFATGPLAARVTRSPGRAPWVHAAGPGSSPARAPRRPSGRDR